MFPRNRFGNVGVLAIVVLGPASVACSNQSAGPTSAASDGIAIPRECRGFPMQGIQYSPGGTELPNTCMPFDPKDNNPYAVRCIDVLPGYETPYAGDEYCILPPPPDKGVQVGFHPQGPDYWKRMWEGDLSGYLDPEATKEFEVAPGDEIEQTYATNLRNESAESWYRVDWRMRTGSHHMASYKASEPEAEGFRPVDGLTVPDGADGGFLWNSQRADSTRPVSTLGIPEDDVGLGSHVDAEQPILFDIHHINTSPKPILREGWMNLWWVEGPVTAQVEDLPLVAPVSVPANSTTVLEGKFVAKERTRVLSAFGHRHAWTRRFNAFVHRTDGTDTPVYESFHWEEVPTYSYDGLSRNPVPDVAREVDGAASGLLLLEKGDELVFDCHVDTTRAHAAELGVPAPTTTLVFGNKAFGAEMCILYAQTVTLGASADAGAGGPPAP